MRILENRKNTFGMIALLIMIALAIWSICGIKAYAVEKADNDKIEYQLKESSFLREVRKCMEESGYYNSGVTLTKVMDIDGMISYTALVHHQDIDLEDTEKVNQVYASLEKIDIPMANAIVNYKLF